MDILIQCRYRMKYRLQHEDDLLKLSQHVEIWFQIGYLNTIEGTDLLPAKYFFNIKRTSLNFYIKRQPYYLHVTKMSFQINRYSETSNRGSCIGFPVCIDSFVKCFPHLNNI